MIDEPKSFWWRIWGKPVRFFVWTMIVSLVCWIGGSVIGDRVPRGPHWSDLAAVTILGSFFVILVLSVIGLVLSAIPGTRRMMMWVLRRWFFCVAAAVTLIGLFYAEEDWRGKRAWEQSKHELEAKGVDLNWDHYLPSRVPDDQNIFKAPKMAEWFVRDLGHRMTNELSERLKNDKSYTVTSATNAIATEADAREYLSWSDKLAPDFKLIREALKRPYAQIDGDYSQPFSSPILNFVIIREVARVLAQRAHCYLLLHQPDQALVELTLVHDLSRLCEAAPTGKPMFLVSAMINVAVTGLWVAEIGDGFKLHAWQESQLKTLGEQLKDVHLMPLLVESLKTEPAATSRTIEITSLKKAISSFQSDAAFFSVFPRGWVHQNLANLVAVYQMPEKNYDSVHDSISPQACNQAARQFEKFIQHKAPFKVLAAIAAPNFLKATQTVARNQNLANQALIACALERYRIAHNDYPESLDALKPQFADKLPRDIINGGPLKYRRDGNSFVLYSVGWNEKDDGGASPLTKDGSAEWDNGDWVWAYTTK